VRKRPNEGATRSQTIYRLYCQIPQQLNEDPNQAWGDVYCGYCGVSLPLASLAATRSVSIL
jgi:tRNA/tmRNA/rRNA uracil-C5-methylase (TrmA/RlmC/RlmD family)